MLQLFSRASRAAALLLAVLALPAGAQTKTSDTIDPNSTGGHSYQIYLASAVDGATIAFSVLEPTVIEPGKRYAVVLHGHGLGGQRSQTPGRTGQSSQGFPEPQGPQGGLTGGLQLIVDAGFYAVSIDQRGHGESGGKVRVMDPEREGRDLVQIVDWVEANVPHLAYRDNNLLLGSVGGSYGGGFQMLLLAVDPKKRLDAMVPSITWYDLRTSLNPQGVIKSTYALGLSAAIGRTADPYLQDTVVKASTSNHMDQDFKDFLLYHSPAYWCGGQTLPGNSQIGLPYRPAVRQPKVDALFYQGMHDVLFTYNEAWANYQCLKAQGGDVRFYTYQAGHIGPSALNLFSPPPVQTCNGANCATLPQSYLAQLMTTIGGETSTDGAIDSVLGCGPYDAAHMEVRWMKAKLQRDAQAIGEIAAAPKTCVTLNSQGDAVSLDGPGLAEPARTTVTIPPTNVTLNGVQAVPVALPLRTLGSDSVLVGTPKAVITISSPTPDPGVKVAEVGVDDPIVFVGLARSRIAYLDYCQRYSAMDPSGLSRMIFCTPVQNSPLTDITAPSQLELIDDQVLPLRGYGRHEVDLVAVGERLAAGEQLQLVLYGYHHLYAGTGSRNPLYLPLQISGTVALPLVANLPKVTQGVAVDSDGDGVPDAADNCPSASNANQADQDADGVGDACDNTDDRDADGDGVSNSADQCPSTLSGAAVNTQGCSAAQRDSDADGVNDGSDRCPGTAAGASVDANGCAASQRDGDGDGVNDAADQCPNTPSGATVNSQGCAPAQLDSDGDGVNDGSDRCANTPAGTAVGADGCPNAAAAHFTVNLSATPSSGDISTAPLVVGFTATAEDTYSDAGSLRYVFYYGDGQNSGLQAGNTASHSYDKAGNYSARVVVIDATQRTAEATVAIVTTTKVTVDPAPVVVTPRLSVQLFGTRAPITAMFDASGSTAPEGALYRFDFGDGQSSSASTTPSISHVYAVAGNYLVTVTVTDARDANNSGSVSAGITIGSGQATTVQLVVNPTRVRVGQAVNFDASASLPAEGAAITGFAFDFGDGSPVVNRTVSAFGSQAGIASHAYSRSGSFTPSVTVSDDRAARSSKSLGVTVIPESSAPAVQKPVRKTGGALGGLSLLPLLLLALVRRRAR